MFCKLSCQLQQNQENMHVIKTKWGQIWESCKSFYHVVKIEWSYGKVSRENCSQPEVLGEDLYTWCSHIDQGIHQVSRHYGAVLDAYILHGTCLSPSPSLDLCFPATFFGVRIANAISSKVHYPNTNKLSLIGCPESYLTAAEDFMKVLSSETKVNQQNMYTHVCNMKLFFVLLSYIV